MSVFEGLIKDIPVFFQLLGQKVPAWIWYVLAGVFMLYLASSSITYIISFLKNLKDQWSQLRDSEQMERRLRRQTFAEHIEQEIRRLCLKEDWKDKRFAELEAEVEVDGHQKILELLPFAYFLNRAENEFTKSTLKHENSLSIALERSRDRLILVMGEPGSGKSVALRHVAQKMAEMAKKSRSTKSIIPIYINLKELNRAHEFPIDRRLIESFILKSLKKINDRDIDQFLDDEFNVGLKNGTWLFLFDSFDELPEILSSTEADSAIKSYGDAITDFLQGMNRCRGIIASRHFHGPKYFNWSHFRILPLTEVRRLQLIRRSGLSTKLVNDLIGQLSNARPEIISMANNPLFLNLLCEHMKSGNPFPQNTHAAFETYIENRLLRDQVRLEQRYELDISQVRTAAENIAFCMAADVSLGLNPTREGLKQALANQHMDIGENFTEQLNALEFIKLAQSEESISTSPLRSFTFAHRRFQEYFATCVVLRDPSIVTPAQLLTNARWRETAVTMCQTQPINKLTLIIEASKQSLEQFCNSISNLVQAPLDYINQKERSGPIHPEQLLSDSFPWPKGLHHLLGLLQDGFSGHLEDFPNDVRMLAAQLMLTATELRALDDRKYALEIAGILPSSVLSYLLGEAFRSRSQWLKEVAYRQIALLASIPPEVAGGIRGALVKLALSGRIYREKYATKAHLARLREPFAASFLSRLTLLLRLPYIDLSWHILWLILNIIIVKSAFSNLEGLLIPTSLLIVLSYVLFWSSTLVIGSLNLFLFFLVLVMRVTSPFFPIFYFLFNYSSSLEDNHPINILIIVIVASITGLSIAILSLAAVSNARSQYYISWILWAFIPFYSLLFVSFVFFSALKKQLPLLFHKDIYIRLLKSMKESIVPIITFMLFYIFIIIFFVIYSTHISNTPGDNGSINTSSIILIAIIGLSLAIITVYYFYLYARDCWRYYKWTRNYPKEINCEELWKQISLYKTLSSFRLRLLMSIREKNLLIPTHENALALKRVAFEIETRRRNKRSASENFKAIFRRERKTQIQNRDINGIIRKANPQFTDEVYKLLESVRSRSNSYR